MACFWAHQNDTQITIPSVQEMVGTNYYKIAITVGDVHWCVLHRYNDFHEFHTKLVSGHGVCKDMLPAKKWNAKDAEFIENRRKQLEQYCQKLLTYFNKTMPREFIRFFRFNIYDIYFLLQDVALKNYIEDTQRLRPFILFEKNYDTTPLELYAVTECLKRPFPVSEEFNGKLDFTNVIELFSKLIILTVHGNTHPYRESNILQNQLPFEMDSFKSLRSLTLENVSLEKLVSVGNLRHTLQKLAVHNSNITNISQVLQCDILHKCNIEKSHIWYGLKRLDLSNNKISAIDESISLVPNLETLILNSNSIQVIAGFDKLVNLSNLSLANNEIKYCDKLHKRLGNIRTLNLSQNFILTLEAFRKLYSLVSLDLSCNKLGDIDDIDHLSCLPCLEYLNLTGNALATIVDYRTKVLERFKDRAKDMCLDNERPNQSELDKVSVLSALRIVKEGRTPDFVIRH